MKTIFQKIVDRELPSEILYEDDTLICIKDKFPIAKIHFLVISKKVIPSMQEALDKDFNIITEILKRIQILTKEYGIENNYRVFTNVGKGSGQTIFHLHFHVVSPGKI